jgi:hypothetical protein
VSALLVATLAALAQDAKGPRSVEPPFEVADHRVGDWNGDKLAELLVVARDGRVRTWSGELAGEGLGEVALADPSRAVLDLAQLGGRWHLIAAGPRGVVAHAFDGDGRVAKEPAQLIPRAKFDLRVGAPTFVQMSQDVNRDGLPDLVLPTSAGCELWMAQAAQGDQLPSYRRTATISVETSRWGAHEANYLSDSYESSFAIPGLDTRDVNGDGRPDLLVNEGSRRAFHLQREDGTLPLEPDVKVDLDIFRDSSTQSGGFEFGAIAPGSTDASYSMRDLDSDEIPDYVIAQGRKVWVFRGTQKGPQFSEPSAILKAAEDITALLVIELDDDEAAELVLIKVQIPTLATLFRGLYGEWDVTIGAVGYRNSGHATFDTQPAWKNELVLRLPGIIGLVKNPGKVLERFDEIGKRFRTHARGDLDGDGVREVMLVTEDEKRLEIWLGRKDDAKIDESGERRVREILFDDKERVWDIDRLVVALGDLAQRQVALLTRGRPFERQLVLRDPANDVLASLETADFDGDGQGEIVLAYRRKGEHASTVFDIVPLAATATNPGGK